MWFKRVVPRLFPASVKSVEGTKWGYINESGKFVLKPQYEDAGDFQGNGFAIVRLKGAGVINQAGRFVVEPKYSSISPFTEGRAVAMDDKGFLIINEKGKVLTSKSYSFISPFQEGRAVFQITDKDGKIVYGYLDLNGKEVIPAKYQYAFDFNEGRGLVQVKEKEYALIDLNGKQLHTFPYEQMNGYSEGLLSFQKTYQDKAGYVDEAGKVVIEPKFGMALPFQDGRAVVNASTDYKNEFGLIDKNGVYIIPPKYNDINILGGNRASVGKAINAAEPYLGSVFAIADTQSGKLLTDFIYSNVNDFQDSYSSVTQEETSFFITKKGTRATGLPVIRGIGTLTLAGSIIKAFVDQRLTYYARNGNVVYSQNITIPLSGKVFIREEKYMPNKDYLVYFPQLDGMKDENAEKRVNQVLKKKSQVKPIDPNVQLDYSYSGDFSVRFFQKALLILELVGYNFPFGAAHGMPSQIEVPINIKTGSIYVLKDLFKAGSDYVKVLSELIGKQIAAEKDGYYFSDAYKGISPDQPFYVNNESLFIYFQPYEIAAFAAGFPTFEIPFSEIDSIINKEGEFWKSFH
jgi:hypothetical protein